MNIEFQTPIEFITFRETNLEEKETFFYYCQWTGNETQLSILYKLIVNADIEFLYEDCVHIDMDMTLLPESVVDLHSKLFPYSNNYHPMFSKLTGKFHFDFTENYFDAMDDYEKAEFLNETFFGCQIKHMFTNSL